MKNFMGLEPKFIWWQGVVEDNQDPQMLGRCKVRILGFHPSGDKNLIPTEHLPWAHPIFPINGRESYKIPANGDWVLGFFRDGRDAQEPVMFGLLPGLVKTNLDRNEKYFGNARLRDRHFRFAKDEGLLNDTVFTSNTNVWWRVEETINSYSNNYIHWSNTDITFTSNTGDIAFTSNTGDLLLETANTHSFLMQANSGVTLSSASTIDFSSNGNITFTATGEDKLILLNGFEIRATSTANSYPIVASFTDLYKKLEELEAQVIALTEQVAQKADAGHSHDE